MSDVLFVEMRVGGLCGTSTFSGGILGILAKRGLTWDSIDGAMDPTTVGTKIAETKPRLVLSCPRMGSLGLFPCLPEFPQVRFGYRTLCNANMMSYQHEWPMLMAFCAAAQQYENAWILPNNDQMLTVFDEMTHGKVKPLPNVYPFEPEIVPHRTREGLRIGIAGRACYSKNMAATAVACMILKRRLPKVEFFVWSPLVRPPSATPHVQAFCQLGRDVTFMPWTHDFREMIRGVDIDIALCPSTTESFGFVHCDFLSCGVPVVGSRAVSYLPQRFVVDDESDPVAIADAACMILQSKDNVRKVATNVVRDVTTRNSAITCQTLDFLLS